MTITYGKPFVFGVQEPKKLRGFPEGRVRIRQRNDDFAQAFVKTPTGIRHFYVEEIDGFWQPTCEQALNDTP